MGYYYVISGVVMLASLFFSPIVSWVFLGLFVVGNFVLMAVSYRWTAHA